MSNEPEPRHIRIIPTEKIITKEAVTLGLKVVGAKDDQQIEQIGNAIASATGAQVVEKPASASTSTLNINYDHPNASTWFEGKKWSASNN